MLKQAFEDLLYKDKKFFFFFVHSKYLMKQIVS